jgi:xanthine dehydrogenase small subunit
VRVELTVNGTARVVETPPLRRLLDILREDLGLTGAKEGCGEGECGACAVLLDGLLVNACLVPAFQLGGAHVTTIEGLGGPGEPDRPGEPDTIQTAFVEEGAVQCGFCIPGMVMATRALLEREPRPGRSRIRAELSGNLCRCTGYERIVRAVERAAERMTARGTGSIARPAMDLAARAPESSASGRIEGGAVPRTLDDALRFVAARGGRVTAVAGATDVMTNLRLGAAPGVGLLDLTRVEGLSGIRRHDSLIEIGATTRISEVLDSEIIGRDLPALRQAAALFGAPAIRNRATVGGNIIAASPAADLPPVLLALGARVALASATGHRELPLEEFYLGYRRTALRGDELLTAIRVPCPVPGTAQAFYKVGTRRAQSIAKVSVACAGRVAPDGTIAGVRIASGSIAPTPVLLRGVMAFLEGRPGGPETCAEAARRASGEVEPINDVRSTAGYRRTVVGRLVGRFVREGLR